MFIKGHCDTFIQKSIHSSYWEHWVLTRVPKCFPGLDLGGLVQLFQWELKK